MLTIKVVDVALLCWGHINRLNAYTTCWLVLQFHMDDVLIRIVLEDNIGLIQDAIGWNNCSRSKCAVSIDSATHHIVQFEEQ